MATLTAAIHTTPIALGQALDSVSTTANMPLGTTVDTVRDGIGGEAVYVQSLSAISTNNWVVIDEAGKVSNLSIANQTDATGVGRKVGICETSIAASSFGWAFTKGKSLGKVAQACADKVPLFPTATVGVVDDATSSVALILGAYTVTTTSTASAITVMMAASGVTLNWSNPA